MAAPAPLGGGGGGIGAADDDDESLLSASFELLELLGKGSYGSVYKGQARDTGQLFAIKVITLAEGDEGFSEIRHEIEMLQECTHPNVVRYFGSILGRAHLWIVMEFCGGGSIRDVLNARGAPLSEDAIAVVCRESLKGLAYLHGMSKVHRDIKCSNILLTGQGQVKLADFGVSAQLTRTMSKRNTFIGTPHWMAPEVIQESRYDGKVDVWALGISAIEMAELHPPRHAIHPMRVIFMISREPPPQLSQPDAWSGPMHAFLSACLQKNARQRSSAQQLLSHRFVQSAPAGTDALAAEVERTTQWLAAQRASTGAARHDASGASEQHGGASITASGGATVRAPPGGSVGVTSSTIHSGPGAGGTAGGPDATVSSTGTFVVHNSWDGGATAGGGTVSATVRRGSSDGERTISSGPTGSTGGRPLAGGAPLHAAGSGVLAGGLPGSVPPVRARGVSANQTSSKAVSTGKAGGGGDGGAAPVRSRSRSGDRSGGSGTTEHYSGPHGGSSRAAGEEALRQWTEDAWTGVDAATVDRILAAADGATLPFLRACDVPPLALIQADAHGDMPAGNGDEEAMQYMAAVAGLGVGLAQPQLLDVTRAMLQSCPPLMNIARSAAFHAAAASAAGHSKGIAHDHGTAEAALVDALRTVLHV